MKVLALADIHLRGGHGTEEADALMKAAEIARERQVDVVLVNGDVFEERSTPEQRLVFRNFLDYLTDVDPPHQRVIVLRGNHDQPQDLELFQSYNSYVSVFERPDYTFNNDGVTCLQILTIPHFNAGAVALTENDQVGLAETGNNLFDRILADYFQKVRSHDGPSIVAFHGTVSGAALDNGMIPRQNGINLNLDKLMALGCPVVGGHYHRCQEVGGEGSNVWYSGSLTRQTYGESEGDKGVLLFDFSQGNNPRPEFISLNPTPMVLIDAVFSGGCFVYTGDYSLEPSDYKNTRVRFRYHVQQQELPTVDLECIREIFAQARELKIEQIVEVTTAVRCQEMTQAESVEDCVRVWLESKDLAPQVESVLALYHEIINKEPAAEATHVPAQMSLV